MTTAAAAIIDFISNLHGMDQRRDAEGKNAQDGAFDLMTGQLIDPSPDFPQGDMLIMGRPDEHRVLVHTHILIEVLIVRTAKAWSITQGGSERSHYQQLIQHLAHKTGFGSRMSQPDRP